MDDVPDLRQLVARTYTKAVFGSDDITPLKTLEAEHNEGVDRWGVWGVPTFIDGDDTAFVRLMERDNVDDLERVLALLPLVTINEFKRPRIER